MPTDSNSFSKSSLDDREKEHHYYNRYDTLANSGRAGRITHTSEHPLLWHPTSWWRRLQSWQQRWPVDLFPCLWVVGYDRKQVIYLWLSNFISHITVLHACILPWAAPSMIPGRSSNWILAPLYWGAKDVWIKCCPLPLSSGQWWSSMMYLYDSRYTGEGGELIGRCFAGRWCHQTEEGGLWDTENGWFWQALNVLLESVLVLQQIGNESNHDITE